MKIRKKIRAVLALAIVVTMLLGTVSSLAAFDRVQTYEYGMFYDVDESGKWYGADNQHVIKDVYELGIMEGMDYHEFSPEGQLTMAQAVTMAVRVHSAYYGNTVDPSDYETYWFEPFIKYAINNGLIGGIFPADHPAYNDAEYWNTIALRRDVASIFARSVPDSELPSINNIKTIPDYIDQDDALPVLKLYNAGVIVGNDEQGNFYPDNGISRAEAAALISRIAIPENRQQFELKTSFADGYTDEEVIDLFIYTALNAEYGDTRDYLIRWVDPISLYVDGTVTDLDMAQLNSLIDELNSIEGFPGISYAEDPMAANFQIHFTPSSTFTDFIPSVNGQHFWGYAYLNWFYVNGDSAGEIIRATVLIDNEESNQTYRYSVIAEELLQALGLLNDNYDYPESIFYQDSNSTLWPASIDWACVKLLYHPYMAGGMTESEARAAAERIIAEYNAK
ncbi:MAG: DUF2927 domain-containing protein [Oscillospiraceae bacterium]|nr:DUF2927 domain-containing protein [Oscillospiraceae bacterium]